jgi:flagellar biogenesis protein FliO
MIGILVVSVMVQASAIGAVTIRDIAVSDGKNASLVMDAPLRKGAVRMEYLRDIVQLTLKGASLYPAKIENFSSGVVKKLFAYQYSPSVVRVRFTVEGDAERFRGKIKLAVQGKNIDVGFTDVPIVVKKVEEEKIEEKAKPKLQVKTRKPKPTVTADEERSLLEKVLKDDSSKSKNETPLKALTGRPNAISKESASPMRAILMLVILLGSIGIFVLWLKRKHSRSQTRPQGVFWQNLFPGLKKSAKFIEVIASSPLGPKQNILLVKVQGQKLVLGVTQDRIQLITQLDNDFEGDVLDDPAISESLGTMLGGTMLPRAEPLIDRKRAPGGAMAYPASPVAIESDRRTRPQQLSFRDEIRSKLNESRTR